MNMNLQASEAPVFKENNVIVNPSKQENQPVLTSSSFTRVNKNITDQQKNGGLNTHQEELKKIILGQEQMLINQYLQLNIKYLSQQLQLNQNDQKNIQENRRIKENVGQETEEKIICPQKKIKKKNKCGHDNKQHYAKGMCNNCYHKFGRNKKPWNCVHNKLYAAGMCQNCYINNYNRKKRQERVADDKLFEKLSQDIRPNEQSEKLESQEKMNQNLSQKQEI